MIVNKTAFLADIENMVETLYYSHIEAVTIWCENHHIEPELVAKIIAKNKHLKSAIKREAEELHFLKKRKTRAA